MICNDEVSTINTKKAEERLLVDYYEKTVSAESEIGYEEIVLYEYDDQKVKMSIYHNGGTVNEKKEEYLVMIEAYQKALDICKKYNLKQKDKSAEGMDGKYCVIKFREKRNDDEVYRISSDEIAENRMNVFNEMSKILRSYINKDNKI